MPQSMTVLLDSTDAYVFPPFICSTGCVVGNYQVTLSSDVSSLGTVVPGIGNPTVRIDGNVEFDFDTAALQTYSFYLYANLDGIASIYAFS